MKKLLTIIAIGTIALAGIQEPANAQNFFAQKRAEIQRMKEYNSTVKDIKSVITRQEKYSNKFQLEELSSLYAGDFVNADGFNKEVYFKLIKDTWKTYPDISYTTKIKNIEFSGNYATVEVDETAVATSKDEVGDLVAIGELYSTADSIYYLEKIGSKWLIFSEQVLKETSSLKYGDARYTNIELSSPTQIKSGQSYTATLKVDAPSDSVVVASINQEEITYPQKTRDEVFRKMPEDNILERVFVANKNNINEYTVASVGITKSEIYDSTKVRVYMGGLAFIMTRVNVVPENNFIKLEDENGKAK